MKTYKVKFPFIPDIGTVSDMVVKDSPMESKEKNALWHLNSMRAHDGLEYLKRLPNGTKFQRVKA